MFESIIYLGEIPMLSEQEKKEKRKDQLKKAQKKFRDKQESIISKFANAFFENYPPALVDQFLTKTLVPEELIYLNKLMEKSS